MVVFWRHNANAKCYRVHACTRSMRGSLVLVLMQRSIQDELDRESQGDVVTIVASYLVMFAYVSLMLGDYHSYARTLVSELMSSHVTYTCTLVN